MDQIFIDSYHHDVLGDIYFAVNGQGLFALDFPSERERFIEVHHLVNIAPAGNDVTRLIKDQLGEYLRGTRKVFDLSIDWSIFHEFQRIALLATYKIPFGETRTYKQIAIEVGSPNGARAVGRAEATNAIPLIIPCHRVLGSSGHLHGYGAGIGLPTKEWLLDHELTHINN